MEFFEVWIFQMIKTMMMTVTIVRIIVYVSTSFLETTVLSYSAKC